MFALSFIQIFVDFCSILVLFYNILYECFNYIHFKVLIILILYIK